MFIDVTDLGDEVLHFDHALRLDDVTGSAQEPIDVRSARLVGSARAGESGVLLEGLLDAQVTLPCSRCLEGFTFGVEGRFELVVVREAPAVPEQELELDTEDLDLFEAANGKVDLGVIAREQIYLNLPLKSVCRTDCRGLCPTCGGNRNRIECDCSRDEPDPRLAPLLELKNTLKKRTRDD